MAVKKRAKYEPNSIKIAIFFQKKSQKIALPPAPIPQSVIRLG